MAEQALDAGRAPDESAAAEARIVLASDLGFAAARDLHRELSAVATRPKVVFEAGGVERMSTAAVLVIVSFLNAREAFSPPAAVERAPGPLVDAFSELGLFGSLMRMEFRT
jgi:hypothetical protein